MTDESNRNHLFLTAILFVFVARFYRGKTYIQGEAPVEEAVTAR